MKRMGKDGPTTSAYADMIAADRRAREALQPGELRTLAMYNAECARGLMHTPDWQAAMARLQERFDAAYATGSSSVSG